MPAGLGERGLGEKGQPDERTIWCSCSSEEGRSVGTSSFACLGEEQRLDAVREEVSVTVGSPETGR